MELEKVLANAECKSLGSWKSLNIVLESSWIWPGWSWTKGNKQRPNLGLLTFYSLSLAQHLHLELFWSSSELLRKTGLPPHLIISVKLFFFLLIFFLCVFTRFYTAAFKALLRVVSEGIQTKFNNRGAMGGKPGLEDLMSRLLGVEGKWGRESRVHSQREEG